MSNLVAISFSLVWATNIPFNPLRCSGPCIFLLTIELHRYKLQFPQSLPPPCISPRMKNFERTGGQTAYTSPCHPSKAGSTNPAGVQRMCYLLRTRQLIDHTTASILRTHESLETSNSWPSLQVHTCSLCDFYANKQANPHILYDDYLFTLVDPRRWHYIHWKFWFNEVCPSLLSRGQTLLTCNANSLT